MKLRKASTPRLPKFHASFTHALDEYEPSYGSDGEPVANCVFTGVSRMASATA
jgi:hypothetical protein